MNPSGTESVEFLCFPGGREQVGEKEVRLVVGGWERRGIYGT